MLEGPYTKMGAIAGVIGVAVTIAALVINSSGSGSAPPGIPSPASPDESGAVPSAALLTTYVEELPYTADSDPYDNRDIAQINGKSYPHSQAAQFCFGSHVRTWSYTLNRSYNHFRATVGLSDNSAAGAVIRFEVLADGRSVFTRDMERGQAAVIDLPVKDILTTTLVSTLLSEEGGCGRASAEWGEVRAERP